MKKNNANKILLAVLMIATLGMYSASAETKVDERIPKYKRRPVLAEMPTVSVPIR